MTVTLYRFFDKDDRLLYVGISAKGADRLAQHAGDKDWFCYVTRATFEHYPTRKTALLAEAVAIKAEAPLYNVNGVPDHILRPGEMGIEDAADYLRITPVTLYRWTEVGGVPHRRRKDLPPVFKRTDLDAWMRSIRSDRIEVPA